MSLAFPPNPAQPFHSLSVENTLATTMRFSAMLFAASLVVAATATAPTAACKAKLDDLNGCIKKVSASGEYFSSLSKNTPEY